LYLKAEFDISMVMAVWSRQNV